MNYINRIALVALVSSISIVLIGCMTLAPILPILTPRQNTVLFYILLFVVIYLIWYIYKNISDITINMYQQDISSRLTRIEDDIKNLKSELKGKNHDKQ